MFYASSQMSGQLKDGGHLLILATGNWQFDHCLKLQEKKLEKLEGSVKNRGWRSLHFFLL
jgi:hypothetical protein